MNHDGLSQKAGVPQTLINEIHGSWYDPANPTVAMSGTVRDDLSRWLYDWEESADLVVVLGSSLAGMTAETLVTAVSKRAKRKWDGALGAVIVGFQQTQHDSKSALRLFASTDNVMRDVCAELEIAVPSEMPEPNPDTLTTTQFSVPYDGSTGLISESGSTLNVQVGARLRITASYHLGDEGYVLGRDEAGHVECMFFHRVVYGVNGIRSLSSNIIRDADRLPTDCADPNFAWIQDQLAKYLKPQVSKLGWWWLEAAQRGDLKCLPVVNCA